MFLRHSNGEKTMKYLVFVVILSTSIPTFSMERQSREKGRGIFKKKNITGPDSSSDLTLRFDQQAKKLSQIMEQDRRKSIALTQDQVRKALSESSLGDMKKKSEEETLVEKSQKMKEAKKKILWHIISRKKSKDLTDAWMEYVDADQDLQINQLKESQKTPDKDQFVIKVEEIVSNILKLVLAQKCGSEECLDIQSVQKELQQIKLMIEETKH